MTRILAFALAAIFLAWAIPATAQGSRCGDRAKLTGIVETKYGEKLVGLALTKRNSVLEIFVNADGTSWTAFVTHPNGMTCVAHVGEAYEVFTPEYGEPGL